MEIQAESSEGESFPLISTLDIEERKTSGIFLMLEQFTLSFHWPKNWS